MPSSSSEVAIRHCDLGKPVLGFYRLRDVGEIWVLTDGECTEESVSSTDATPMVRVLNVDASEVRPTHIPRSIQKTLNLFEQLKEISESVAYPGLLRALNSSEVLNCTFKNIFISLIQYLI